MTTPLQYGALHKTPRLLDRRTTHRATARLFSVGLWCLSAVAIAGTAVVFVAGPPADGAEEEPASRSGLVPELTREEARVIKQMNADLRQITIFQANVVHARFVDRCMESLTTGIALHYQGALGTETGRRGCGGEIMDGLIGGTGQRVIGGIGAPLTWSVEKDDVIFLFCVSTRRTKETLATCSIEGKDIFVNASFVDGNRSVDAKLPELGGRSVREVISAIEKPSPDESSSERKKTGQVQY